MPSIRSSQRYYQAVGVHAFMHVFSVAAAKGVENATIRAMNATKVVPDCQDCPPNHCAPPGAPTATPPATSLPSPIFWDQRSRTYQQLDPQGRRREFVPDQHADIRVRHEAVTGITTVLDAWGNLYTYDPRSIPPRSVWWNRAARRLETQDERGNTVPFDAQATESQELTRKFEIHVDGSTWQTILTDRETGLELIFQPISHEAPAAELIPTPPAQHHRRPAEDGHSQNGIVLPPHFSQLSRQGGTATVEVSSAARQTVEALRPHGFEVGKTLRQGHSRMQVKAPAQPRSSASGQRQGRMRWWHRSNP